MKAIPTRYAGCHFRSRLEARWAVFFDTLEIAWDYEPEGVVTEDGTHYLPDFWLPELRVWFEVKGQDGDWSKWRKFHEEVNPSYELVPWHGSTRAQLPDGFIMPPRTFMAGPIPRPDARDDYQFGVLLGPGSPHGGWAFGLCSTCGTLEIGHVAWDNPLGCGHSSTPLTRHQRLLAGYRAARSARFEHGETPR